MNVFSKILNKVSPQKKAPAPAKMPEKDLEYFRSKVINAAAAKRSTPPTTSSGTQPNAYGKAMASAFKNTKTFGMPGK